MPENEVFIPLRHICAMIGVDWGGQRRRVLNDPVLSEVIENIDISATDDYRTVRRAMLCLPLDYLSGFLFGINANRVKTELRMPLMRYQRDAYKILDQATRSGRLKISDDMIQETLMTMQQLSTDVRQLADRVSTIEAELGNEERFISVSQAEQISQAVRSVGLVFSKATGRNEYGAVYGELYRQFSINSYKRLPAKKFNSTMTWLRQWYEELSDDGSDAPF